MQKNKILDNAYVYDVALSFAGEDREYVEEVALQLKDYGVKVFYDKFEEANLWGKNLYDYLSEVYTQHAQFTVMFISESYKEKLWTNHEREAMQERAFVSSSEYILPVRFDNTIIPGIRSTVGYIDLENQSPSYLVSLILEKIGWQLDKRWWGDWKVEASSSAYSSSLKIYEVTHEGFLFNLSTYHGAHTGKIDGIAKFVSNNEAAHVSEAIEDEICKLTFRKMNDVIQVNESEGCAYYHGMRAYFGGDYNLQKDSFYEKISIDDINLSSIYKILGNKNWLYYADCFSDIHRLESLDGDINVFAGGMPGLYTICESILMVRGETIWGAYIKDEVVNYFTNSGQEHLPNTIIKWKERFSEKEVVLLK